MRLTSKGQVTIPIGVRRKLGLKTGQQVDFVIDGDGARLVKQGAAEAAAARASRIAERLQRHGPGRGLSTDALMRLMRGDDWPDLR